MHRRVDLVGPRRIVRLDNDSQPPHAELQWHSLANRLLLRGFRVLGEWNYRLNWGSAPDPGIL
jgi:hypothetical protein